MTREELEAELDKILDYDMTLYDLYKAVYVGIRYGFEKARLRMKPDFGSFDERRYESAEQVIEELDNDAQKAS